MAKSMSLCFSALFLLGILHIVNSLDCDSCGRECKEVCGTKKFRNCCFNYIRKRDSGAQLELMMIHPEASRYYWSFDNALTKDEDIYDKMNSGGLGEGN